MVGQYIPGLVSFTMDGACTFFWKSYVVYLYHSFDDERKGWSDKGHTYFNRKNNKNGVFYGLDIYKKEKSCLWEAIEPIEDGRKVTLW